MSYKRKTKDELCIQGMYDGKWELETYCEDRKDARDRLKEYEENCPGTSFRIHKIRVPIPDNELKTSVSR